MRSLKVHGQPISLRRAHADFHGLLGFLHGNRDAILEVADHPRPFVLLVLLKAGRLDVLDKVRYREFEVKRATAVQFACFLKQTALYNHNHNHEKYILVPRKTPLSHAFP